MIDIAKVADLVLLLCDASFGFEMEIFEFLNICQVHGMPRIMGILTHLDMIKNNKTLKNTKKTLKHRFWTEVYPGAKLFYLSGILHGEYLRNEIKNLGRFISVMKFRPLTWRTTHSYLLGDRYEDLTNLELIRQNPKCERNVSLYGYVRGVPLNKNTFIHVAGYGDAKIHEVSFLPDPCPLPELIKKRALIEKEKFIYAPFSGVGGIVYDKDAVYVELGGSHSHKTREDDSESNNIVTNLIDTKETLDVKMQLSELQLFTGGTKLTADDVVEDSDDEEERALYKKNHNKEASELDQELDELRKNDYTNLKEKKIEEDGRVRRKVIFQDTDTEESDVDDIEPVEKAEDEIHKKITESLKNLEQNETKSKINEDSQEESDAASDSEEEGSESDDDEEEEETRQSSGEENDEDLTVKWKENLSKKAKEAFLDRRDFSKNIMKVVYGVFDNKRKENPKQPEENTEEEEDLGGLFKVVSQEQLKLKAEKDSMNLLESSLFSSWNSPIKDWLDPENKILIENCFVTGKWNASEDASELLKLDDAEDLSDDNSEVFGDFEDLETGEKHSAKKGEKRKRDDNEKDTEADKEALTEKKRKLKEKFDSEYDQGEKNSYYDDLKTNAEKQAQLNKSVFENMSDDVRVQIEGYRPGMYVRIEIRNVPAEFITNFDPTYPLVIGALNMGEENIGYVNVKIKKHRWSKRILKANDPLIVSLGWRRFQTVPLYSKLEDDMKLRYLKYTPEHLTCNAHFWGPITPQGTGFLALQSCDFSLDTIKQQGFRIAATGAVQELDKSTQILKKLKLIGYPLKIYKKTAFIKGSLFFYIFKIILMYLYFVSGMFNSALEVAKFEGAKIKTVSGIRGQIKKAESKPEGCFRATFEDKIQLSGNYFYETILVFDLLLFFLIDIVFCRTWYKVDVQQFYTPVSTLLLPPDKKNCWKGLRTTGQIKREMNIRNPANKDSIYTVRKLNSVLIDVRY